MFVTSTIPPSNHQPSNVFSNVVMKKWQGDVSAPLGNWTYNVYELAIKEMDQGYQWIIHHLSAGNGTIELSHLVTIPHTEEVFVKEEIILTPSYTISNKAGHTKTSVPVKQSWMRANNSHTSSNTSFKWKRTHNVSTNTFCCIYRIYICQW